MSKNIWLSVHSWLVIHSPDKNTPEAMTEMVLVEAFSLYLAWVDMSMSYARQQNLVGVQVV